MSGTPLQLALREVHAVFVSPPILAAMALVGIALGLVGPFGTYDQLALVPRLAYWLVIAFASYGAGTFGAALVEALLEGRDLQRWVRVGLKALGAALPVTLAVLAASASFFPDHRFLGPDAWILFVYCYAISLLLITLVETIIVPRLGGGAPAATPAPEAAPILERLPPDIRGPLTHMSMADHYVDIHTRRGRAMVLMRLADAIAETRGVEGYQIHRSHWVAAAAVRGIEKENGRPVLVLDTGVRLPVSRSHLARLRERFGPARR
ncbi:LytTR family DNA-binding domain-containing protein [Pelagibacterium montanilacus]|uniref:LytTR family DNA-binding domain-containing protein n=1 Tax=Pelagibacterium montanilacus TaxID=2185280 RepID=UPI000F8D2686|nr:LytTR family DNA-binding domain-containing protein [Pelagibacterium montanilacus]